MKKEFQKVSLHEISPYIGKFSALRANELVAKYTRPGQTLIDPFCGSSVLPLEAAINGCNVIAADINPYAIVQTRAKLFAPTSLESAMIELEKIKTSQLSVQIKREIPDWVKSFFHPKTLKEVISYSETLKRKKLFFHLACLLGILHHQRPGFLSYPSSHTTPYLRDKKFPKNEYPELYGYRAVKGRLKKKVSRTMRNVPSINSKLNHMIIQSDIRKLELKEESAQVCITSPPYMNNLAYGRDNRLRLWFLGIDDWHGYDNCGYSTPNEFRLLMNVFFAKLNSYLVKKGLCVLVVGEARGLNILDVFKTLGIQNGFEIVQEYSEAIPDVKRSRKGYSGTVNETVLVFKKV